MLTCRRARAEAAGVGGEAGSLSLSRPERGLPGPPGALVTLLPRLSQRLV